MKYIKLGILFFLVAAIAGSCTTSKARENVPVDIKRIVESKNFVFKADIANPVRGGNMQLSSGYDLTITPASITAYLPFYGRAQTVPIGSSDGGIKFTSTNFDYAVDANSKTWKITIKTNDVSNVRQLFLTIFTNGTANLDVMNINRDDISFRGSIR